MTHAARSPRCVLMTADPLGGVWTYAVELARALGRRGVSVVLAVMGAPLSREQRSEAAALPTVIIRERPYRLEWMEDPWADVDAAGEWLLQLEHRCQPDCIHLNGFAHGALPFRAPAVVVAHSCCATWWQAVRGTRPPDTPAMRTYIARVTAGLRGADAVVAPTRAMWHALESTYGRTHDPLVIWNARTADHRPRPARKRSIVCGVGRLWDDAKNLASLDAAADGLPWPVTIAGPPTSPDGHHRSLRHADALGTLTSDDVRRWLRRALIYASPARYEPFGLSVLEAARQRCALVLGDIPSFRELWDGAAVFVPPDDVPGLRRAMATLIADPAARRSLAERAHARSQARAFEPDVQASRYLEVYARIRLGRAA